MSFKDFITDQVTQHPEMVVPVAFGAVVVLMLILALFHAYRMQRNKTLDFTNMITYSAEDPRVSLTKVLQLVGGVTATWIVIKMTIQGTLTFDIFGIYLAYVASIETFSKFFRAKYGNKALPEADKEDK